MNDDWEKVTQTAQSAVSQVAKPASVRGRRSFARLQWERPADLAVGDTADLAVCATLRARSAKFCASAVGTACRLGSRRHGRLGSLRYTLTLLAAVIVLTFVSSLSSSAQTILLSNGIVHTVSGPTVDRGLVLFGEGKILEVGRVGVMNRGSAGITVIDLGGQHIYPGFVVMDSVLGLAEIGAVRATRDTTEVGDFTPEVESWVAINPDSELIPVARANGVAYFEAALDGGVVAGQSAVASVEGWTYEQMTIRKPVALHLYWPSMNLSVAPKERASDPSKWKSIEDQAKERRARLRALDDFFAEARAYAKAKDAAARGDVATPLRIPAWEAMVPYVRGELPLVIHADEVREIGAAVSWAVSNRCKAMIAGGRDAWMLADVLASNQVPVIFEHTFTEPARDFDPYDVHFKAPAVLQRAGVEVLFSVGPGSFGASAARNLPYAVSQSIAFGLPEAEGLKGITLYPAQRLGVSDRLGSIEPGKEATLFVSDGPIFDIRSNVRRMWIVGKEVSLESRHTRLYQKYRARPERQKD